LGSLRTFQFIICNTKQYSKVQFSTMHSARYGALLVDGRINPLRPTFGYSDAHG